MHIARTIRTCALSCEVKQLLSLSYISDSMDTTITDIILSLNFETTKQYSLEAIYIYIHMHEGIYIYLFSRYE